MLTLTVLLHVTEHTKRLATVLHGALGLAWLLRDLELLDDVRTIFVV